MKLTNVLGVVIILLSALFLGFQYFSFSLLASGARALAMSFLTLMYFLKVKDKNIFFIVFLILYSIGDMIEFAAYIGNENQYILFGDYSYIVGMLIYMGAYLSLILRIFSSLNLKEIFIKFWSYLIVLTALSVFCIYFISETIESSQDVLHYVIESSYNIIILLLMSSAFINYMYQDDKKSMNILIGSICILFSEILQLAYFYIVDYIFLNLIYSIFFVLAFVFFYLQSLLNYTPKISYNYDV